MAAPLPYGMFNISATADIGKGPGAAGLDAVGPVFSATVFTPSQSSIVALIAAADAAGTTLFVNFAGSRNTWTDAVGSNRIYNATKYENNVRAWTVAGGASTPVAAAVTAAIASRRILAYTVDEPQIATFGGSLPVVTQNSLGLLHKLVWPGVLTCQRTSARYMTTPPSGGWTGLDYGWSQYEGPLHVPSAGETAAQFFAREKSQLAGVNVGMVGGFNFLDGGDGRFWDYQNTGSSNGRIVGNMGVATRWMPSPAEVQSVIDATFNDAAMPAFLMWTHVYNNFPNFATFSPLYRRSDYITALNYGITKAAARSTFSGFRNAKGVAPTPSGGGPLTTAYSEVTARTTTPNATYTDVPGASIASGSLTPGNDYLISVMVHGDINTSAFNGYFRTIHGATAFDDSEMSWQPNGADGTARQAYWFWDKWTAITSEGIKLQFRNETGQTFTVGANQVTMVAIPLSGLPANSYFFGKDTSNTPMSLITPTPQVGASANFTPPIASHDWLLMTQAQYSNLPTTASVTSGMRVNTVAAGDVINPVVSLEGEDSLDVMLLTTAKVATLPATSHIFEEQSAVTANTGTVPVREHTKVFALDLSRFTAHGFAYTTGGLTYAEGGTFPTQAQTAPITLGATTDVWVLGRHSVSGSQVGMSVNSRLQTNNVDQPPSQTNVQLMSTWDVTDVVPIQHQTVESLTAGTHNFDLDAGEGTMGTGPGVLHMGSASAAANTVAFPAHQTGDLIIVTAVRSAADATIPTQPGGYTNIAGGTANNVGTKVGYKIAASSGETSGTWTNATALMVSVYRGTDPTTPIGANHPGASNAASATITYKGGTLDILDGTSWVHTVAVHSAATDLNLPPTGYTHRANIGAGTTHDTNAGTASWIDVAKLYNASGAYRTHSFEIRADPAGAVSGTTTGKDRLVMALALALPAGGANSAPVLASIGNKTVVAAATLSFTISATDADLDAITYSVLPGTTIVPTGLTLNASTGAVSWTPDLTQLGTWNILFRATDNSTDTLVDDEQITITVTIIPDDGNPDAPPPDADNPATASAAQVADRALADLTAASELAQLVLDQMQINADVSSRVVALAADLLGSSDFMQQVVADQG